MINSIHLNFNHTDEKKKATIYFPGGTKRKQSRTQQIKGLNIIVNARSLTSFQEEMNDV